MAELHAEDTGFVRAPPSLVHAHLADVARWPAWWPGVGVRRGPAGGRHERWELHWRAGLHRLTLWTVTHGHRPGAGFHLTLNGDLRGRAEFWLEATGGGTVVHHLLAASPRRARPATLLRTYRRVVRRGLWACHDVLHDEVRRAVGLDP